MPHVCVWACSWSIYITVRVLFLPFPLLYWVFGDTCLTRGRAKISLALFSYLYVSCRIPGLVGNKIDKTMTEMKRIINQYLVDKDYEKALLFLKNQSNEDDEYSSLLEVCEKGFVEDCTARIAHFAQIKDKESAEEVVEKYISLIGQDTNVTQWETLINSIQSTTQTEPSRSATVTSSKKHNKRPFNLALFVSLTISILIGIIVFVHHKKVLADKEAAQRAAIAQAEYNRNIKEKEAKEARENAIRDSIAAIEQARQDSIDRVEHAKFVKKYSNIGLIVLTIENVNHRNDYGDMTTTVGLLMFNPTKKNIKYVVASLVAINAVWDIVSRPMTCRGVGPVKPHEFAKIFFDDVFYDKNNIIKEVRASSFRVTYTDGTSKNIKMKDALCQDFEPSWFE